MHPATKHVLDLFEFKPFSGKAKQDIEEVRQAYGELAGYLAEKLPDTPDVTYMLRVLMDAKNWAVLAIVADVTEKESLDA